MLAVKDWLFSWWANLCFLLTLYLPVVQIRGVTYLLDDGCPLPDCDDSERSCFAQQIEMRKKFNGCSMWVSQIYTWKSLAFNQTPKHCAWNHDCKTENWIPSLISLTIPWQRASWRLHGLHNRVSRPLTWRVRHTKVRQVLLGPLLLPRNTRFSH